jgi:hypothetical protein
VAAWALSDGAAGGSKIKKVPTFGLGKSGC